VAIRIVLVAIKWLSGVVRGDSLNLNRENDIGNYFLIKIIIICDQSHFWSWQPLLFLYAGKKKQVKPMAKKLILVCMLCLAFAGLVAVMIKLFS
jgi:hypothetical protein